MERRAFLMTGAMAGLAAARVATAQPTGKLVRIGRLSPLSAEAEAPFIEAFRQGLREQGRVDGKDFVIVTRLAQGKTERLPALARDLVRQHVDVILTGSHPGVLAARSATDSIPIVMVTTADPVEGGIVASLARPGGNVTGLTALGQALSAKRLQVLREAVPGLMRVAVLVNPTSVYTGPFLREKDEIARQLGLELRLLEADEPGQLRQAFGGLAAMRPVALMVLTDPMFIAQRRLIVELVGRHRVPALYPDREFVDAGGLMFYGASLVDLYRRAAVYVDRVLGGARPADLPIEQPTTFELAINLRTARDLGLTIPPALLARADRVIR
jgi:putative ABC transport system substrate-binding protein